MKKLIVFLTAVSTLLIGCDEGPQIERVGADGNSKVKIQDTSVTKYTAYLGPDLYIIEAENHKYAVTYSGGITHAESCSCKK